MSVHLCKSIGCVGVPEEGFDFCSACNDSRQSRRDDAKDNEGASMSEKYPKYYKNVEDLDEVDVYAVHNLFQVQDYSGALHHASKKLLLSGVRTGGKSQYKDIKEARDTLTRWLQLNPEQPT